MGFKEEVNDVMGWFYKLSPLIRTIIIIVAGGLIVLFTKSFGYLVSPLLLIILWSLLTIENRTVSNDALFLAAIAGLFAVIPLAGLTGSLLMIFLQDSLFWSVAVNTFLECLIVEAFLLLLLFWPQSRLKLSASILDFGMIGLWIGAGMEFGMGLLGQHGITTAGIVYGLCPQLPGLLGHKTAAYAAAGPAVIGLLLGIVTGLVRYLAGPAIQGKLRRMMTALVMVLLLLWIITERLIFMGHDTSGLANLFFTIDLKGRLLTYLTFVLGAVVIAVEWLLLREYELMTDFKTTWQEYKQAWSSGKQATLRTRLNKVIVVARNRRIIREMALAEDIKPLLIKEDIEKNKNRIALLNTVIQRRGTGESE